MAKQILPLLLAFGLAISSAGFAQQQVPPPGASEAPSPPTSAASPRSVSAPPPAPAAGMPSSPSKAQVAPHRWDVDRVSCADLLKASDDDRASSAMFYYGYLAAKAGIHVIDVSRISGNIAKVMELCKARPELTVPQAFRQALLYARPAG